jgi:hypothetical protein
MKIVFLADSNQPGESGVGDYALHLCASLQALNVDAVVECLGAPNSSLRACLANRVRASQPDWVSLQFVPYAYAHRGWVGRRTLPWKALRGRLGTHVMFHEIWIGAHQGASLRDRAMGALQRRGIQHLISELRPDRVHCGNRLYSAMLLQAGLPNQLLPLFGNIPVRISVRDPYEELLVGIAPDRTRSGWVVAALFGSIYPSEHLLPALRWLHASCVRQGRRLLVVSLGHCPMAETTFAALASQLPAECRPTFLVKGRLDSTALSAWIRWADCGLATTPFNIIEKSGSAVAFAEHGVPVIVMDAGADVRDVAFPRQDLAPEYWLFGDQRLEALHELPPRRDPRPRLEQVAKQFLADLGRETLCT